MTDDLLKRASAALREETADADEGARFTRARVLSSLQQSQVRRRSRLAVLLPLAACFAAATAFGMVSGQVPRFVRSVSHTLGFGHDAAPPLPPAPLRQKPLSTLSAPNPAPSGGPLATPAENAALDAEPPAASAAPAPEPRSAPALRRERTAPLGASTPLEKPSASAVNATPRAAELGDISDRAHELYRVAHRSHFVEHDFVSALRAWDAYLEAAPNGRFVLEARYNRALCLVRLGRKSEARDALAPFANGKFASYRQEEARALIQALDE